MSRRHLKLHGKPQRGRYKYRDCNRRKRIDPLDELNGIMCNSGLSVSEAIRSYTNLPGLPKGF